MFALAGYSAGYKNGNRDASDRCLAENKDCFQKTIETLNHLCESR